MSGMRWADSDSDSEEEYVPPSQQRSQDPPKELPGLVDRPAPAPVATPFPGQGSSGGNGGRGGGHPRSDFHDNRGGGGGYGTGGRGWDRGGGGRSGDGRGRGRGAGRHQQPNKDWKLMAKESSRFTGENDPVDGSAWMAQRRAKKEHDEKERKEEDDIRRQKAEEEKRERRKEQMSALKAAVVQIKGDPPSPSKPVTSLQRAAMLGEHLPSSPHSHDRKPISILSRDKSRGNKPDPAHEPEKDDGRWPRAAPRAKPDNHNKNSKSVEKQMYSTTISGPPKTAPKDDLQPDGSEKFSRRSFTKNKDGNSGNHDHEAKPGLQGGDGGLAVNDEEHSVDSGGKSKRKNFFPGRGGRGRGGRNTNDASAGGEDASVGSNVSRGSGRGRGRTGRGGRGGRGRGRHENDSGRGGRGRGRGRGGRAPASNLDSGKD